MGKGEVGEAKRQEDERTGKEMECRERKKQSESKISNG